MNRSTITLSKSTKRIIFICAVALYSICAFFIIWDLVLDNGLSFLSKSDYPKHKYYNYPINTEKTSEEQQEEVEKQIAVEENKSQHKECSFFDYGHDSDGPSCVKDCRIVKIKDMNNSDCASSNLRCYEVQSLCSRIGIPEGLFALVYSLLVLIAFSLLLLFINEGLSFIVWSSLFLVISFVCFILLDIILYGFEFIQVM